MKTRLIALLLVLVMAITSFLAACGEDTPGADTSDTSAGTDTPAPETEKPDDGLDENGYEPLKYGQKKLTVSRVSSHDPSIVYDHTSGKYYIFGSHRGWLSSTNLANWQTMSLPMDSSYRQIFKEDAEWSKHGNNNYDVSGNMWAPDVIYNEAMGKWCMYMSINGDNYYSSIVLLTSDKINGKYERVGTVVYSGFINSKLAKETDYEKVVGNTNVNRYVKNGRWNTDIGPNAIDPCVFYDEDGKLWMAYGSWFGGIYLLELDENTGLRNYDHTYKNVNNKSDKYFGVRLSGGYGGTGEGSYIVYDKVTGYYYMYLSYCGLNATDDFSGYHIRLFRSENVEGPYVDAAGNSAIKKNASDGQSNKGIKLFGNYYFSSLKANGDNSNKGYMSPGHNSAFIDTDGQHYLVYHTRFNLGNEWHAIRIHQQFMNEDGWPVTAVYEHQGSVISESGYDESEIVGKYEFIDHGLAADTKFTDMLPTLSVELTADGKITGSVRGTWEQVTGEDGKGYYATFVIKGVTYKGVFFKQRDESRKHTDTMTFTLIGENNHSIWGSKID